MLVIILLSLLFPPSFAQESLEERKERVSRMIEEVYDEFVQSSTTLPFYMFKKKDYTSAPEHYIFGSFHTLPEKFLPKYIKDAVFSTNILVIEKWGYSHDDFIELGDFAGIPFNEIKERGLIWEEDFNWLDSIEKCNRELIEDGLTPTLNKAWGCSVKELHPAFVCWLIKINIEMRNEYNDPVQRCNETTMDQLIVHNFQRQDLRIISLENERDRLEASGILDALVESKNDFGWLEICETINEIIRKNKSQSCNQKITIKDYKELLTRYLKCDLDDLLPGVDRFTENRNKIWHHRLRDLFKEYPTNSMSILVGAAHLIGDSGLIKFLEMEGFDVKLFASQ